jgi:hypothetical protein
MQQQYSPDGRWWWDGSTWRPVTPPGSPQNGGPPGMFWFFNAPGWAGPFFLTGLISLIPIVGQMVVFGWYLAVRDTLRAGYRVLPPAGFQYLERGVAPWVASLVYALYFLPVYLVLGVGLLIAIANQSGVATVLAGAVLGLFWLAYTVTFLFLTGALFDLADSRGIGEAIRPAVLWRTATADTRASWRVFTALLVGGLCALAIGLVLVFVPFGGFALGFVGPGVYLMAAPAQADFNRPAVAAT